MTEASFASLGPTLLARKGGAKPAMRPQLSPLPQNFGEGAGQDQIEDQLEDLGWNDMGGENADQPGNDLWSDEAVADQPVSAVDFDSPGDDLILDPLMSAQVVSITSRKPIERERALPAPQVAPQLTPPAPAHPAALNPAAANEDSLEAASPLVQRQQKRLAQRILADAAVEEAKRQVAKAKAEAQAQAEAQALAQAQETAPAAPDSYEGEQHNSPLLRSKTPAKQPSAVLAQADMAPQTQVEQSAKHEAEQVLAHGQQHDTQTETLSRKAARKNERRAAFTLRLDTDRHLKLRLAATMQGVSAQALVTEALDAMLEAFDDLDDLAERMKRD